MALIFEGKSVTFTGNDDDYPTMARNGKSYVAQTQAFKFDINSVTKGAVKVRYFNIIEDNEIRIYTADIYFGEIFKPATPEDIEGLTLEVKQYIAKFGHHGLDPDTLENVWIANGIAYPAQFQAGY